LLQSDSECTQGRCAANFMKLESSETRVTAFTRKQMYFIILIDFETLR
jgi:hypothetical protein